MSDPDTTKLKFAQELNRMLQTTPLAQIRVVTLCRRCGTVPQTFYYHFHDKYALVAWIFLTDFASVYADQDPAFTVARITQNLERIARHKTLYRRAYTVDTQNAINRYIQRFNVETATTALQATTGHPATAAQILRIKYHSYGTMGLFAEWLTDTGNVALRDLATLQYQQAPAFLKRAYAAYPFTKNDLFKRPL
ncbi:TetR family transcriptional regulator [Levilactobacillus suantsaii]|uniref:TetR family transcriptional regulator n=1 Tax=Levilactobacillus suantsaii TaxID=2292255 RepID=A0A4Q0VIZ3_9LACO|nr:TetR family transcriptional regulator [Levilactobacillus suantsaii]QMU08790.1 TetR family transcriptional regulator [Levilactobacillus suantsaii]RXI78958.1 TetR family transcriptional regulator [Levilactobacillus suantsaii]